MAMHTIDTKGLKCPQPVLRLATKSAEVEPGDMIEISGDCPSFESDIQKWSERMGKTVLEVVDEGAFKRIKIQF